MSGVLTLVRKHAVESRWTLGVSAAAFFGLSVLTAWLAQRFERLMDEGQIGPAVGRLGPMRLFGGPAMDFSTTALEVMWWNHPVIVLTLVGWAVARGSTSVAGEIERGTLDVTLSRPVPRSSYLVSQVAFTALGLVVMVGALVAGSQFGRLCFTLKAPPSVLTLLKPSAILVATSLAIYGYTLPFSTVDVVRWRPTLISAVVTLGGLVAMSLSSQFPDWKWLLDNLSVFQLYAPVTVALKGDPLAWNVTVLMLLVAAGTAVSLALFVRRDLPTSS